jgi:hypothetical protein
MPPLPAPISPDRWLGQLFGARIAAEGGIVRRKVSDVERLVGRRRFLHEVDRRGYHLVENAGQFVIFCNQEPVVVLR